MNNNKVLVVVYVPTLEKEFEIYIPLLKKIGTIKNLILKIIAEDNYTILDSENAKFFYDKKTGNKLDDNMFVKTCDIKNGTKLILF